MHANEVNKEALGTLMADVRVISEWVDAVEDFATGRKDYLTLDADIVSEWQDIADRALGYADTHEGDPFFIDLAGIVGHWSVLAAGILSQSEQLRDQQLRNWCGEGIAKLRERITVTLDAIGVALAD